MLKTPNQRSTHKQYQQKRQKYCNLLLTLETKKKTKQICMILKTVNKYEAKDTFSEYFKEIYLENVIVFCIQKSFKLIR